jgi:hypothetical protein
VGTAAGVGALAEPLPPPLTLSFQENFEKNWMKLLIVARSFNDVDERQVLVSRRPAMANLLPLPFGGSNYGLVTVTIIDTESE